MQEQSKPYDGKVDVWVPDKELGFLHAKILKQEGDKVHVNRVAKGESDKVRANLLPIFLHCRQATSGSFRRRSSPTRSRR